MGMGTRECVFFDLNFFLRRFYSRFVPTTLKQLSHFAKDERQPRSHFFSHFRPLAFSEKCAILRSRLKVLLRFHSGQLELRVR